MSRKMARQRAARQRQQDTMKNLQKGMQEEAQRAAAAGTAANPHDPKGQVKSMTPGFEVRVVSAGAKSFRNTGSATQSGNVRKISAGPALPTAGMVTQRAQPQQVAGVRKTSQNPAIAQQAYGSATKRSMPGPMQVPQELVREQTFEPSAPPMAPAPAPQQVAYADVTVVITVFERPGHLRRQLQALHAQTIKPAELIVWANAGEVAQDGRVFSALQGTVIRSNRNHGAWPRFREALDARTTYVCLLDDDTIPGPGWMEAALQRIQLAESDPEGGTLCIAAAGEVFRSDNPDDVAMVGLQRPPDQEVEVDIGRQGWLLRRDLLRHVVAAPYFGDGRTGWNFHLAALLQMQGVLTVVLPYTQGDSGAWGMLEAPTADRALTGVLQAEAMRGGQDMNFRRRELYNAYRQQGWTPLCAMDFSEEAEDEQQPEQPEAS